MSTQEKPASNGGPIVIVSGAPDVDSEFVGALEKSGLDIVFCKEAKRAFSLREMKPRGWAPAIIIIDTIIPQASGYDVLRRLSNQYSPAEVSFAMMTKYQSIEDKVEASNAGARTLFVKPIEPKSILEFIEAERQRKLKGDGKEAPAKKPNF